MSAPLHGLRVVNVIPVLQAGGPSEAVLHYARALVRLGAETHLWSLEGAVTPGAIAAAEGIHLRSLGASKVSASLRTTRLLTEALAEVWPDWVHAHAYEPILHSSRALRRGVSAGLIATHHDARLRWSRRLWAYRYRTAPECVIFLAREAAAAGLRWYGYPPERTAILPLPVDVERFSPGPPDERLIEELGLQGARPVIMWTGRLHRLKGHADLLRALPSILAEHPAARLVFVGSGRHEGALRRLTDRLGLGRQVLFTGRRNDVPELLRLCHIFACPSHAETLCQSLQEAMATGLPVVSARMWSAADLIEENVSGLVVPIGSPPEFAQAINRIAGDAALADRFGQAARQRAVQRWSPEVFTRDLGALYQRLLGRQRPA